MHLHKGALSAATQPAESDLCHCRREAGNETYWEAAIFAVAGQLRDLAGDQARASHPLGMYSAEEVHPQSLVL